MTISLPTSNEISAKNNEDIEVIENEDSKNTSAQPWTVNQMRGFKRRTQPPTQENNRDVNEQPKSEIKTRDKSADSPQISTGRYCHFFANTGHCNYEERTGLKCKFDHKQAPQCRSGLSCNRNKCMFSHPRPKGIAASNFLVNPWQVGNLMNPWLQTPNPFVAAWQSQSR